MRFLFDYVSCCLVSTPCTDHDPPSQVTPATEETRSLVASAAPLRVDRRRQRVSARGTLTDWRPSLYAISEDNAVAVAANTGIKVVNNQRRTQARPQQPPSAARNRKRCGPSSVRVNAHSRSYEHNRDPLPIVMPTFSATPFMF